ncbi:MAG: FAD-dependent oxidoreductase [Lentisphaeria bacterium]|jgi:2,4-dienoyl-CoA reductase-like NADH-dependent reductase (Old Yellow Enzyme family)/thioredoxin reductase|nr:FAD-dependent oxidoreductase [Lentisphaeria bacterium]
MPYDMLLREGRIGSMTLPTRIITGPMEKNLANRDGSIGQRYIDYLTERARGGAGLIQVESTYVDTRGMGHFYQVGCHGDHVIPGLKRVADSLHALGAKVGLELYMGGRETPSYMSMRQPIAPSVVRCEVLEPPPTPRRMTHGDIKDVIRQFTAAAGRVVEAGMDMVHLHGAHGYLLSQFLSPYSNRRTDKYGGSREKRATFALELLAAVRKVVGPDLAIGYRLSAEEYIDGGLTIEDTADFCQRLADAGIDLIDVSGGIYESFEMIIQGPESPKGGFVRNAAAIKKAVGDSVPVSVAQRLNDPEFANEVLRREGLDFISLSRAFHADPHYVAKLKEDRADEIIPCIACHHCTNLLEINVPGGCSANPHSVYERSRRIRPASQKRSILVAGGGPAGMHAARILAEQGNRVHLVEAGDELGGQMRYSSRGAVDYGYLVQYLTRQMDKLGVEVSLGTRADTGLVKSIAPDAVVVATGAVGGIPFCPFKGSPRTFDLFSAMDRPDDDWEDRVVIIGGDSVSCFVALYIAGRGAEVHVVEPGEVFSEDKLSPGRDLLMMALQRLPTIHLRHESTVEEVREGSVLIQSHAKTEQLEDVGSVVIGDRRSDNCLYDALIADDPELEIYNIGDSVAPRDIYCASHEAAEVAELIRRGPLV